MLLLRLLRNALLVALAVAVLYLVAMFALCRIEVGGHALIHRAGDVYNLKGGNTYRKFHDLDRNARYDVVVLGSSHAYRGYDPRFFARSRIRMFNLGTSAQTPLNSYAILKEYVSASNAGLVVLDVYENVMGDNGLESTADLSQNITSDAAVLRMLMATRDPRVLNMFTVRKFMADVPPAYVDTFYAAAGFSERKDSAKGPLDYDLKGRLRMGTVQLEYLAKCIRYCRSEAIPVVLVTHPMPLAANHARHRAFNTAIDSLAMAEGVTYLDFAIDHGLPLHDRHHFYDHNHLNQAGVEIFNAHLLESLRIQGLFPERRRTGNTQHVTRQRATLPLHPFTFAAAMISSTAPDATRR